MSFPPFKFEIESDTDEDLVAALGIVLAHNKSGIYGFQATPNLAQHERAARVAMQSPSSRVERVRNSVTTSRLTLHFLTEQDRNNNPISLFPAPIKTVAGLVACVLAWLEACPWPNEPDTDGSNKRGFRIIVDEYYWTACVVEPAWVTYGK